VQEATGHDGGVVDQTARVRGMETDPELAAVALWNTSVIPYPHEPKCKMLIKFSSGMWKDGLEVNVPSSSY
jgi:hypothetical protein